jgi:hypothetical protein
LVRVGVDYVHAGGDEALRLESESGQVSDRDGSRCAWGDDHAPRWASGGGHLDAGDGCAL